MESTHSSHKVMRMNPMCRHIGISRSHGYWLRNNDPTFPRPVRLGKSAIGFLMSDVEAWLKARQA